MTDYYLGLGYGQTYSTGTFAHKPTLPLSDVDTINSDEFVISDDPMDYDAIREEQVAKLEPGDSLTITYPNQEGLYILDEWAEDYHIPHNQREELWTSEGIEDTFLWFINAEDENWYWLTNAQVDYYDEDDRPVPIYPADQDNE